jgi:streptomycin 6-kinase
MTILHQQLLRSYLDKWDLLSDGESFRSFSSILKPVIWQGKQAMLKIALEAEEKKGNKLMVALEGNGAALVFKHDDDALLMERLSAEPSLYTMAQSGNDDDATVILINVASRLHNTCIQPALLHPLDKWFTELFTAAQKHASIFKISAVIAKNLLSTQQDQTVLHGDLHHQNVMFSGTRGWLAIDPKGLYGERGFDYANIFCNPNEHVALRPGRLEAQLKIICEHTGMSRERMLQWIVAYSALSASWHFQDNSDASLALSINAIALRMLNQ